MDQCVCAGKVMLVPGLHSLRRALRAAELDRHPERLRDGGTFARRERMGRVGGGRPRWRPHPWW